MPGCVIVDRGLPYQSFLDLFYEVHCYRHEATLSRLVAGKNILSFDHLQLTDGVQDCPEDWLLNIEVAGFKEDFLK